MSLVDKPSFNLLQRSLDASSLRQRVISNNIANVDTPYFKRSEVKFEDLLQQQMSGGPTPVVGFKTDPRHFDIGSSEDGVTPQVVVDSNSVMNNNLNNVDIDSEMTQLAQNELRYNIGIQQVNHDLRNLRTAIDKGR